MFAIIILGIVQGLTEFLPVSSSGHLVLFGTLLGLADRGLAIDVALHVGTLVAVVVVFRRDLLGLAAAMLGRRPDPMLRRLGWLLAAATVPIVIAGPLLRGSAEQLSSSPRLVSLMLYVTAALMLTGEALRRRRTRPGARPPKIHQLASVLPSTADPRDPGGRSLETVRLPHAGAVGLAQCLALLPGISRSGVTIAAGTAAGLTRIAATRFSFLLSLPALVGATILTAPDLARAGGMPAVDLLAGITAAFVAGYAAIRMLLFLVARIGLAAFAGYCIIAGTVGLVLTST